MLRRIHLWLADLLLRNSDGEDSRLLLQKYSGRNWHYISAGPHAVVCNPTLPPIGQKVLGVVQYSNGPDYCFCQYTYIGRIHDFSWADMGFNVIDGDRIIAWQELPERPIYYPTHGLFSPY